MLSLQFEFLNVKFNTFIFFWKPGLDTDTFKLELNFNIRDLIPIPVI